MGKEEEKQTERGLKKVYDKKNEFEIHNSIYKRWTKREKIHNEIYFEQWGFLFLPIANNCVVWIFTNK